MKKVQWENSTEILAAHQHPALLLSSPHRLREEGHTHSPCPGPTMGTQAKQSENRKTRAKTWMSKIFLQLRQIKSVLKALAPYHKSIKSGRIECQTECKTN